MDQTVNPILSMFLQAGGHKADVNLHGENSGFLPARS
jgi:hypothetical protein